MADLGAEAELINATEVKLKLGADTYIFLQECELHMGRPEERRPTTGGGAIYYYGKGDHYFTFAILATTPELDDFGPFTETDANGDLPSKTFTIVYTPRGGGSSKTATVTGVLPDYTIEKADEGAVLLRGRVRITTDTVAIA